MIWNSYPKPYVVFIANHPHMQLALSLSFVKLLWPLVRFISYSHDQDHVHISTTCYASTLEESKNFIHPQNKTPCSCMTLLSLKNMPRVWGYAKRKIKDAYPKKVCHMLRHVKKKDSPLSKKKEKGDMVHTKESIHHPPKISTHLHILIKDYDLFLFWIWSLT